MAKKTKSPATSALAEDAPPVIVSHPPRPNRALLAISIGLWLAWLGFLLWLAWQS